MSNGLKRVKHCPSFPKDLSIAVTLAFITATTLCQSDKKIYVCGFDESTFAGELCNHLQENARGYLHSGGLSTAAEYMVASLLEPVGLPQNFKVSECRDIRNAVATTYDGERYIIFDPDFVTGFTSEVGDGLWLKRSILAHEIGHHLCGHTLKNAKTLAHQRDMELEADEFAGFILGRLGATEREALLAVNRYGKIGNDINSTHPSKTRRQSAVLKGYQKGVRDTGATINRTESSTERVSNSSRVKNATFAQGIEAYNRRDYRMAGEIFDDVWTKSKRDGKKEDFAAMFNSALCSEKAGQLLIAAECYAYLSRNLHRMSREEKVIYEASAVFAASCYRDRNMPEKAIDVLTEARYGQPESMTILIELINIYLAQEAWQSAIPIASAALDIDPLNIQIVKALAAALDNAGMTEKSREMYMRCLTMNPNSFWAFYNLGSSFFNEGVNLANKANDLWKPRMTAYENSRQRSLESQALDAFISARPYLEAALELEPKDVNTIRALRDIYARTGQNALMLKMSALLK